MSEDDGMMLMNIAVPTSTASSVPSNNNKKVTGGKWKDRRKLERRLNGKPAPPRKQHFSDANSSTVVPANTYEQRRAQEAFKKQQKLASPDNTRTANPSHDNAPQEQVKPMKVDKQIVSSLFTSSKEIATNVNTHQHDGASHKASNAPLAGNDFSSLGITSKQLLENISKKLNIETPTKIQKYAIPELLNLQETKDLFIHAQTGSGKTLAFLLPILENIISTNNGKIDRNSGCFAMIITPTRELASQIHQVFQSISVHYLVPCLLIGGEKKKSEKARLRKGCNVIIGTPGRILDHLTNTRVIKDQLHGLKYLVLDEGDRLMELGFEESLKDIFKVIHEESSQNIKKVLCSATISDNVGRLGESILLKDYKIISSGKKNKKGHIVDQEEVENKLTTAPDQLLQKIVIVPPKLRLVTLAGCINNITTTSKFQDEKTIRTIVFLSCADSVEFHYNVFAHGDDNHIKTLINDSAISTTQGNTILPSLQNGDYQNVEYVFYKLHGSLSQQSRTSTLNNFINQSKTSDKKKHLVMFCTDVASRGLDLPQISTVVELDPPFAVEDHLHRIGRTARAGVKGESLLFLLPGEEEGYMDYIKPYHPKGWDLLKYDMVLKKCFHDSNVIKSDGKRRTEEEAEKEEAWDNNATTWHLNVERRVLDDPRFKTIATNAFLSHIRAYATHISKEKPYFNVKYLHLGHLCKSFALREKPKTLQFQKRGGKPNDDDDEDRDSNSRKRFKGDSKSRMLKMANMVQNQLSSEFNY